MKTSKLIAIIALGGLAAFGTVAQAQDATNTPPAGEHHRPGGPGGPRMGGRMAEELGLSADQKTKFEAIMKDQAEQMKTLRDDTSLSQEDKRAKIKAIREATNDKVKAILTADQYAKYLELQKLQHNRRGPGGPGGAGTPPPPANN